MQKYKMWIGGEWVDAASSKTYREINPATEKEIAELPLGDKTDIDKAIAAAQKAFPVWSKKSQDERSQILIEIAAAYKENATELAMLDTMEHGTPITKSRMMFTFNPNNMEWIAQVSRTIWGEYLPTARNDRAVFLKREPVGVCALIVPWNASLPSIISKMAPALAVGNTCVIKPPSINSITPLKFAEILEKFNLPPGTVNIVTGGGDTAGETLVSHPGIRLVSFTGSSETGKRIMELASQTVTRLVLELGGKNPFIVLEDANVDMTAAKAAECTQMNSGQVCASPGRYYVHEKIHDEFIEKYINGAKACIVGDPTDEKTMMGPVVSAEHRNKIEHYINTGIKEGAKLVLGGKRPTEPPLNKGYYVMPTVFTGVTQDMAIAREEIFGPVACILKYSDESQLIEMANDTVYGLCASVWTRNTAKGIRFANEINAGTVWINDHMAIGNEMPFGGFKESGFGKVDHIMGIEEYTQVKQINFDLIEDK